MDDSEAKAYLVARKANQKHPSAQDVDLLYKTLYSDLNLPSSIASSSTSSTERHWFCPLADSTHKEIATYLIFAFALLDEPQSSGTKWKEDLKKVLQRCQACARRWVEARRRFESTYISKVSPASLQNFASSVDTWTLSVLAVTAQQPLFSLPAPSLQLVFTDLSVLWHESLKETVSLAFEGWNGEVQTSIVGLGLSLGLLSLFSPPPGLQLSPGRRKRLRRFARTHIRACSSRPLTDVDWTQGLFDAYWDNLLSGLAADATADDIMDVDGDLTADKGEEDQTNRWRTILAILSSGALSEAVIERQILSPPMSIPNSKKRRKPFLLTLSSHLSTASFYFPLILKTFCTLVRLFPSRSLWEAADPGLEFPLVVWGDIKSNGDWGKMIVEALSSGQGAMFDVLEEPTEVGYGWVLAWLEGYLESVKDLEVSMCPSSFKGKEKADNPFLAQSSALAAKVEERRPDEGTGFSEALARVVSFAIEEMQHSRFSVIVRAGAMEAGLRALKAVYRSLRQSEIWACRAMDATLSIHAGTMAGVVFGAVLGSSGKEKRLDYFGREWDGPKAEGRALLEAVMDRDCWSLREGVNDLGSTAVRARSKSKKRELPDDSVKLWTGRIHDVLWSRIYGTLGGGDVEGTVLLIKGQAGLSHLAIPDGAAWTAADLDGDWVEGWRKGVTRVRRGMGIVRKGFGNKVEAFAVSGKLGPFWATSGVASCVMRLLLSPHEEIHDSILSLTQESYEDVVLRQDSFRAMLEYHPAGSLEGLLSFLRSWSGDLKTLPSGVEGARWLVKCLTDLVDVFCRGDGGGFLRDPDFLGAAFSAEEKDRGKTIQSKIPELWGLMTKCLALIFELTPVWAKFYDNAEMVAWMTDALIFGRMMVEETRTFEAAALGNAAGFGGEGSGFLGESPRGLTGIGRGMIGQLEIVLGNIVGWLRLTDIETLHQTFELIKLLLRRFGRSLSDDGPSDGLRKSCSELDRFSRRVKGTKTKLDDGQLSDLTDLLQPFITTVEEDASDDGIEYVSSSIQPSSEEVRQRQQEKKERKQEKRAATPKKDAFAELMRNAERDSTPRSKVAKSSQISGTSSDAPMSTSPGKQSSRKVITIGDSEDEFADLDDPLAGMTPGELARLERAAASKASQPTEKPKPRPPSTSAVAPRSLPVAPRPISTLLSVHRPAPRIATSHGILGKIRREVRTTTSGGTFGQRTALSRPPLQDRKIPHREPIERQSESSDSTPESSSDDQNENRGLGGLKRLRETGLRGASNILQPARIKLIRSMPDAASTRDLQRQSAQRTKQRLKPDVTDLYRELLSWDPRNTSATLSHPMRPVPPRFKNALEFKEVFTPMLYNEVWSQSLQELENSEMADILTAEIAAKYHTDEFIDLETTVIGLTPDRWHIGESDFVILKSHVLPTDAGIQAFVFAKIQGFKRTAKGQTTINLRLLRDVPQLQIKRKWVVQRHLNLSTAMREFSALRAMPFYEDEMVRFILEGKPAEPVEVSEATVEKAMLAYDVNEPQAKSIVGAMRSKGFVLIQGPPGTGKTKTISGLAGRFLAERPNPIVMDRGTVPVSAKLLICAPSNTAIDEVVRRLMGGVSLGLGRKAVPKVVRIGADASMHALVKDVSIDSLVETKLTAVMLGTTDTTSAIVKAQQALDAVGKEYQRKEEELQAVVDNEDKRATLRQDLQDISNRRKMLRAELNRAYDSAREMTRKMDAQRRQARDEVLKEADIICSTLAGAGLESISFLTFETVIIDEAAQAIELSALIPLKYRCTRCIMIGDPNQLPPTVISQAAGRQGYDQSLFVRMQRSYPDSINLLSIQYRMHPFISVLPSRLFYDNRLVDGPDMATKTIVPWHGPKSLGTYRFFNVSSQESSGPNHSKTNMAEVQAILELYRALKASYGYADSLLGKIGVISMYRGQVALLKNQFRSSFGIACFDDIDFGTVDGFQGQEKTVIILSCVRAGSSLNSIGFLSDFRRMNVALTRAKSSLFVFGNTATLARGDERWKVVVEDAKERAVMLEYNKQTFSAANTAPTSNAISYSQGSRPTPPLAFPTMAPMQPRKPSASAAPPGPVQRLGPKIVRANPANGGLKRPTVPVSLVSTNGRAPLPAPAPIAGAKRAAPAASSDLNVLLTGEAPPKKKIKRVSDVPAAAASAGSSSNSAKARTNAPVTRPSAPQQPRSGPITLAPPPGLAPRTHGLHSGFRKPNNVGPTIPVRRPKSASPDEHSSATLSTSSSEDGEIKERPTKKLKSNEIGAEPGPSKATAQVPAPPPKKKLDSSSLFIKKKKPTITPRPALPPSGR